MADRINAFLQGIPNFIIGIVVVFAMLFLLIGFMMLLGYIMEKVSNQKKPEEKTVAADSKKEEQQTAAVQENVQDDLELVAVITAAIAASLGTTSDRLQVRSLKKVERKSL